MLADVRVVALEFGEDLAEQPAFAIGLQAHFAVDPVDDLRVVAAGGTRRETVDAARLLGRLERQQSLDGGVLDEERRPLDLLGRDGASRALFKVVWQVATQ